MADALLFSLAEQLLAVTVFFSKEAGQEVTQLALEAVQERWPSLAGVSGLTACDIPGLERFQDKSRRRTRERGGGLLTHDIGNKRLSDLKFSVPGGPIKLSSFKSMHQFVRVM